MKVTNRDDVNRFYQYWQYLCGAMQILALIFILLLLVMSSGYLKMGLTISIGGDSPPPNPGSSDAMTQNIPNNDEPLLNDADWALLLDHRDGEDVNDEERAVIRELFEHYDIDNDECLSKDEFSDCLLDTLHAEEGFALLDVDNDGVLEYSELVWLLTQVEEVPEFTSTEITDDLREIFGDIYSDESEPEFLALVLFDQIDIDHNNAILKSDYLQFEVDVEWNEYDINDDECVNYEEFESEYFQSIYYKQIQKLRDIQENGEIDLVAILNDIKSSGKEDIDSINTMYYPHEFDASDTRRLQDNADAGYRVARMGVSGLAASNNGCYDDQSLIEVLNKGMQPMKDVMVGDYVYDGNGEYSKIFYMDWQRNNFKVKMNKIKYGNPMYDNSITLTLEHLLYKEGVGSPVKSEDISIGDVLNGHYMDYNYTVYAISIVYATPIHPFTNSGDMMVDGVKTSVYTRSNEFADMLQKFAIIPRWISDNINEQLAVKIIDFYCQLIYKKIMNHTAKQILLDNKATAITFLLTIHLIALYMIWNALSPKMKSI